MRARGDPRARVISPFEVSGEDEADGQAGMPGASASPAAIFGTWQRRRRAMARVRQAAQVWGAAPERMWQRSSANVLPNVVG